MDDKALCRIGVFYDGSYFTYARRHFYFDRQLGWLEFRAFHGLIESYLRRVEQGPAQHRVVYAAWFQGLFTATHAEERQLKSERHLHHDLMHAGIDPKYIPMPQSGMGEKGSDVALAIDAVQVGLEGKIDIAVLVTGDGDFVPLARALMKHGIRVMVSHFQYEGERDKAFCSDRLLNACNYSMNVNALETDKEYRTTFKGLFRREGDPDWKEAHSEASSSKEKLSGGQQAVAAAGRRVRS